MKTKDRIRSNFSAAAPYYDQYSLIQNKAACDLISKIKDNGFLKILDIGCGTGNFTKYLQEKFPKAKITALDISKEMVAQAKDKLNLGSLDFIVADAQDHCFKEKFDLISSNVSFQWFKNLDKTLAGYNKILNSQGSIMFSIFGPDTFSELQFTYNQYFKESRLDASNFLSKENLKAIIKKYFPDFKVEEKNYQQNFDSLLKLLKNITYTGAGGLSLKNKKLWTHKTISKLEEIYLKKFKTIKASYQVFFVRARR